MSHSSALLILYNANTITIDCHQPQATQVVTQGNKIISVDRGSNLAAFKGMRGEFINCQGKTLLPGFYDAHCHPLAYVASLLSVDCTQVRSIRELQLHIGQQAVDIPQGTWIRGASYNEFYLAEKRHPNRWDLDAAAPYHPVKLSHRSGHAIVLNTLALQQVGISRETPDPPGGLIERDLKTGEPTGVLYDMEEDIEKAVPFLGGKEWERGIALANEQWLSQGITSLQDATGKDSIRRWRTFQALKAQSKLKSRVCLMIGREEMEQWAPEARCQVGDERVRLGAVKIVLQETSGSLYPPLEQLRQQVLEAHQRGCQLALHAVEESTVSLALEVMENALLQAPREDHRHRIEHCSVCPPLLIKRLKGIQALVVTQPSFLYHHGERYMITVAAKELEWLYPLGSLLKEGVKIAAGSDAPVVPPCPLLGIYAAVTRKTETGHCLQPQERVPPVEALKMYTINAAYSSFEEQAKGSITPGKLADLVLLSDDPTKVPPEEIKDIEVLMTIVDGEVVWEK